MAFFGVTWVVDNQGHSLRLFVMRPLARKAAIAHVIAVIG